MRLTIMISLLPFHPQKISTTLKIIWMLCIHMGIVLHQTDNYTPKITTPPASNTAKKVHGSIGFFLARQWRNHLSTNLVLFIYAGKMNGSTPTILTFRLQLVQTTTCPSW